MFSNAIFRKVVPSILQKIHCVKRVRIRSFSGPYFSAFGLSTERYGVSLPIQSKCGKIRTWITPNMDTFHAVIDSIKCTFSELIQNRNLAVLFLILNRTGYCRKSEARSLDIGKAHCPYWNALPVRLFIELFDFSIQVARREENRWESLIIFFIENLRLKTLF